MKRSLLVMGVVLSVAVLSFPQDASIYREAGVVPFSFDLNGWYCLDYQSPNWSIYVSDYLDLTLPEDIDQSMFTNDSSVGATRYFTNLIPVASQQYSFRRFLHRYHARGKIRR